MRGERIWEAHRSHYYQRLVLLGWGHRRTVLAEYLLMLACAGFTVLAVHLPPHGALLLGIGGVGVYGLLMGGVSWLERRCCPRTVRRWVRGTSHQILIRRRAFGITIGM